jgi:hypothetical protein
MGHYKYIVKTEEIRKKMEEGDLLSAQKILDTIEIKKVKNISDLGFMAEVLTQNDRFDEAARLYERIYETSKTRRILGKLVDISIKRSNAQDAEKYLEEYEKIAAGDFDSYIFHYKIDKIKGASYEQMIKSLEAMKQIEYTEKWAYELAKVYYKAGMEKECVKECSDIVLWFADGVYVEKAKMLRSYFTGETDKEKMMEELKRRSDAAKMKDVENQEPEAGLEEYAQPIEEVSENEESVNASEPDFMEENEAQELEYGLSQEIADLMTDEEDNYDPAESEEDYATIPEAAVEDYFVEQEEQQDGAISIEDSMEDSMEVDRLLNRLAQEIGTDLDEIFGDFLPNAAVKEQLAKDLELVMQEDRAVFIIITGSEALKNIELAKNYALFLSKAGKITSSKVAKITAGKLNNIDLNEKKNTLRSCCMIVEEAGKLKPTTIERVRRLAAHFKGDFAVILEDEKENMNKLFKSYSALSDLFDHQIDLPDSYD